MVAAKINFQQGAKRNLKPMEIKEKHEHKGKNQPQNSSKGNSSNNKAKEKGVYKGKNRLTPEELERYRKDNRCFKCGEQGHAYQACPQRNACNEQPRASIIEAPKEDVHCKGSPLSYAWGKVREHDAFILFDLGSTHNFISHELAAKLSIQEFEMGDAMKADGAFIGQDASVTPLIGKLRLHIQGYVDKEDFFISPLKHEDVILGAPWFYRLAASIKFPERRISFKFTEKNMYIDAQESGNTIPLATVNYGMFYEKNAKLYLYGYTDADWVGDFMDRRSPSGYAFSIGNGMISWSSKKQPTVALSSTEAEYRGAALAACEESWLRVLMAAFGFDNVDSVTIYCDNISSIMLAKNPVYHARTKHIEVHYHFIREKVLAGEIDLVYVKTNDQVADIFTKALGKEKFCYFCEALGILHMQAHSELEGEC
ncbi:hypothetical protein L7F22_019996 [Adiantum nelumboides]|nr:hypothetical protein [Adiantum nelumboides]